MITDVRPAEQRVERLLDQDLAGSVDVRGRLVENEDARVGEQRPRDRDQLPFAGGEPRAALADDVVEPAVEAVGDPVDADRVRGRGDLLVGRVGPAEADVVRDRAAEQERVLEHDAELAPDERSCDVAQVDAVDPDARPRAGRRSARSASRSSTCRRPTRRRARCSRLPARRSRSRG